MWVLGLVFVVAAAVKVAVAQTDATVVSYPATQDALLERSNRNMGTFSLLIIAKHTNYPLKRSLVQFETPEDRAGMSIVCARAELFFTYAHRASFQPNEPWANRDVTIGAVLMPWNERQVTTTIAEAGTLWPVTATNPDYLHNPEVVQQSTETVHEICEGNRSHWTSWDVTAMAVEWATGGLDNNGVILWATNEQVNGRDLRFAARENGNATIRPVLRVAYAPGTDLGADCSMFEDWSNECPGDDDNDSDDGGSTTARPATTTAACRDGMCPGSYAPVCGANGVTYSNSCRAGLCNVQFRSGACGSQTSPTSAAPTTATPASPPPTPFPTTAPTRQFAVAQGCQGEQQRLQQDAAASDLSFVGETVVLTGFDQRTCGPERAFQPQGTRARFQLETLPSSFQGVARADSTTGRVEITSHEAGNFAARLTAIDGSGTAITIARWSFVVFERPVTDSPTQSLPTRQPTSSPTRHACSDGSHGCDVISGFGICEQVDNGAGYQCSCAATHRCSDGGCGTTGHTCVWLTDAPTPAPTTSPSPTPTRRPTAAPHSSLPTGAPIRAPSVAAIVPDADSSTGSEADSTSTTSVIIIVLVVLVLIIGIVGAAVFVMRHQKSDGGARPNFDNPMYACGPVSPTAPQGGAAYTSPSHNAYMDVPSAPDHPSNGGGGSGGTHGYMDVAPSQASQTRGYMDVASSQSMALDEEDV